MIMEAWGRGEVTRRAFMVKRSYCCGINLKLEVDMTVLCAEHKTRWGMARVFLGWLLNFLHSCKTCTEVFSSSGNDGSSAIWTFDFLIIAAEDHISLNFANVTGYILFLSLSWTRSDSYVAFSPWDDLQTKTVLQISTFISFQQFKITLLSQINWVPAPVLALGSWWILSFNEAWFISFFPKFYHLLLILNFFWVQREIVRLHNKAMLYL